MSQQSEPRSWRQTAGPRLLIVGVLLSVWAVAVFVRLVDLQIYQHEALEVRGKRQQTRIVPQPALRGDIVDRHGMRLAYTVEEDTLSVDPSKLENPRQAVARLCGALQDCTAAERADFETRFSRTSDEYEEVRPWVTEEQARRVAALEKMSSGRVAKKPGARVEKMPGVRLEKKPRRYYPNRELAASVLGFIDVDGEGLAGLERRYEVLLSGRPGKSLVQKDGNQKGYSRVVGDPPVPGATIELTIDAVLQAVVERELRAGVEENRGVGGCALIMDPATGEILAMASEPTFDPNAFDRVPAENRLNRAVQGVYEPGSTFKIVTGSAALEDRVLSPTDLIDTGNGTITIGARVIREAQGHRYGTISLSDVIVKSSNVGAVKVGLRLTGERLGRYVGAFGFGTKLSPDFRGESRGWVPRTSNWSDSTLASVAMGYEVSVTPLQMAAAASAVANGGELVTPRIVRAVIDGDRRQSVPRKVIRRVISPETAAELTSMMEGVVERGTAQRASLAGFTVAGKTGTATKNQNGHYLKDEVNASFVGFVPSRQPALTILVVIDTPRGPNPPYGGTVAAPVFNRIAEAALRLLGVAPTINPAPPVLLARYGAGAPVRTSGSASPVTIVPASAPETAGQTVLPELRGLSGREALRILMRLGITPRLTGEGVVIEQDPLPGSPVEPGGACRLALGRLAPGGRP